MAWLSVPNSENWGLFATFVQTGDLESRVMLHLLSIAKKQVEVSCCGFQNTGITFTPIALSLLHLRLSNIKNDPQWPMSFSTSKLERKHGVVFKFFQLLEYFRFAVLSPQTHREMQPVKVTHSGHPNAKHAQHLSARCVGNGVLDPKDFPMIHRAFPPANVAWEWYRE